MIERLKDLAGYTVLFGFLLMAGMMLLWTVAMQLALCVLGLFPAMWVFNLCKRKLL